MVFEGATKEKTLDKVLFVCTANICRSPMAEAMFNALAEDKGLPFRAESAGVRALVDEEIAPDSRAALDEVGIYSEGHHARQVSEKMLEEAELVLVMGPRHVATLQGRFKNLQQGKVYALPEYALGASAEEGIPDPYGLTMTAYRASVRQLLECVEGVVERLEREGVAR